tara:strand:+ start:5084 stop:5296 length:213 start_codon:yes stop_codon:yes gene_type:complete
MSDISDEQEYNMKVLYKQALERKIAELDEEFKEEILLTYLGKNDYQKLDKGMLRMIKGAMTEYAVRKPSN